jgi:hypothetical protein
MVGKPGSRNYVLQLKPGFEEEDENHCLTTVLVLVSGWNDWLRGCLVQFKND